MWAQPCPAPAPHEMGQICWSFSSVCISTAETKILRIPSLASIWEDAVLGCFGMLEGRVWVNTAHPCSFPGGCDVSGDGPGGGGSVDFGSSSSQGRFQGHILCDTAPAVPQGCSHGREGEEERPSIAALSLSTSPAAVTPHSWVRLWAQGWCFGVFVLCSSLCSSLQPGPCHPSAKQRLQVSEIKWKMD